MKRSLRVTLLTVLLGLTGLTVGIIGAVAYFDTRDTATDLTQQALREESKRIEHEVGDLVGIARRQVLLNQKLLETGSVELDSPASLIDFWDKILIAYPQLNALYLTRGSDGATSHIFKTPDAGVRVELLVPLGNNRFNRYFVTVEEAKRGQKGVLLGEGSAAELDPRNQ